MAVGVGVGHVGALQVGVFAAQEAVHVSRRFERAAHLGMVAGAFARRSTAVHVLRAEMRAVAARNAIEADRLADEGAVFDAWITLVD